FRQSLEEPCALTVVAIESAVGCLPPLLGHIDFGAGEGFVPCAVCKASEAKKVPADVARRVSVGQERREPRSGVPHLVNLRLAQFADHDRFSATQQLKCSLREPCRLLDAA